MTNQNLEAEIKTKLLAMQQDEINSYHTYKKLSRVIKDPQNSKVLDTIADAELGHYDTLREITQKDIKPNWFKINLFFWLAKILGLTFGIKLMEKGEELAQITYKSLVSIYPQLEQIWKDEEMHENELVEMLDEEGLKYAGSVVLGLNDALVELTGALAGLTFAFQNTNIIALAGMITGISASFSMAASEYLSNKADEDGQNPIKSAIYTGIAYVVTVIILIFPYLIAKHYLVCLAWTILNAILIIAAFNYYISVAKDYNFKKRFTEMTVISLGVALFSFVVGVIIRSVFGIDL
ncbi:MAG: VIT1/CCC1 transporter family protein [Anaerolineaceae bacterium]|nr:VIT1/CCC1 transporter family protein [Anaerolineaceae bacterium]